MSNADPTGDMSSVAPTCLSLAQTVSLKRVSVGKVSKCNSKLLVKFILRILLLLKPEIAHGSTAYIKYLPPFLFIFSKTKQF